MSACILTLKLLAIFIYDIVVCAFIHQVNGLIANHIIIGPILNIYLSKVFAVIALSLGKHPTLLIIRKLQLKFLSVLVKFNVCSFVFIALSEISNTISLANYASNATIFIISLLVFTIVVLFIIVIKHHIILSMIVQVVLLLFRGKTIEIDILTIAFIITFSGLNKLHISIYREKKTFLTTRCEKIDMKNLQ